ncbi:MAG: hypothetical protein GY721_13945 [Deltaproteobacteria bacterium]|nr:hypothetical protein [Deltaproteobacteria bacterium]
MKDKTILLPLMLIVVAAITFGCSKSEEKSETAKKETPAYESVTQAPVSTPPPGQSVRQGGIVREVIHADVYTYLNLEDSEKVRFWVAVPKMEVKADDGVEIFGANQMANFHSKTLNRTFDTILFASSAKVLGKGDLTQAAGQLPPDHPPLPEVTMAVEDIEKSAGGYTVAELYSKRNELKGKEVQVRGKVVKYSAGIMNKNWLHIRDGSGKEGTNDITVTTMQTSSVGEVVTASGRLETDKNFGGGYHYAVIIQDASITTK